MRAEINVTQLYISNQKLLYNISVLLEEQCVLLGLSREKLDLKIFNINPVTDLGIVRGSCSDPKKC